MEARSPFFILVILGAVGVATAEDLEKLPPSELFQQRILPIFNSPNPSSCVQCHLAGVDLKDYIFPSQEATFQSLRIQGLVDLDHPERSKILDLIRMGEKDLDKGARLIHEGTRQAELTAFSAWIKACCNNPDLRSLPVPDSGKGGPSRPSEVIRHARKSRVVDSFVRNIWSQRMRCFPCHTPHEIDENNPKHQAAIRRQREFEEKHGAKFASRLRIFRETPEATLQHLIDRSRNAPEGSLPLLNLKNPEKSLIILKPTAKLPPKDENGEFKNPSFVEPVSHMGGLKMHVDDQSYKSFIAWIQDYARVVGDDYTSVAQLPADNWYGTQHAIMLRGTPAAWPAAARVQFFVHAWDEEDQAFSGEPVAFTQGTVTPRKSVAGALFLLRPKDAESKWDPVDATLSPGKYMLKAYVDTDGRLSNEPTLLLGKKSFYGQTVIQARWENGFRNSEKLRGEMFQRP